MSKDNQKKSTAPERLSPREIQRRNMVRFGTTMTPRQVTIDPALLAKALNMCASAGLPEPVITEEYVIEGQMEYPINVYTFADNRVPPVACKVTEEQLSKLPEKVVQLCKSADILSDSMPVPDESLAEAPPPPPEVRGGKHAVEEEHVEEGLEREHPRRDQRREAGEAGGSHRA